MDKEGELGRGRYFTSPDRFRREDVSEKEKRKERKKEERKGKGKTYIQWI